MEVWMNCQQVEGYLQQQETSSYGCRGNFSNLLEEISYTPEREHGIIKNDVNCLWKDHLKVSMAVNSPTQKEINLYDFFSFHFSFHFYRPRNFIQTSTRSAPLGHTGLCSTFSIAVTLSKNIQQYSRFSYSSYSSYISSSSQQSSLVLAASIHTATSTKMAFSRLFFKNTVVAFKIYFTECPCQNLYLFFNILSWLVISCCVFGIAVIFWTSGPP